MSTALAIDPETLPELDPVDAAERPDDGRGAEPRAAGRPRHRVLAAGLLATGAAAVLVAQLLISIDTAGGAYELGRLQADSTSLARQQQVRTERLEVLASPQHLAARAAEIGMVPSGTPAALRADDGQVLGSAKPAASHAVPAERVPNALLPRR